MLDGTISTVYSVRGRSLFGGVACLVVDGKDSIRYPHQKPKAVLALPQQVHVLRGVDAIRGSSTEFSIVTTRAIKGVTTPSPTAWAASCDGIWNPYLTPRLS